MRGVPASEQTCGDVTHVAFNARDLSREKEIGSSTKLKRGTQQGRGICP